MRTVTVQLDRDGSSTLAFGSLRILVALAASMLRVAPSEVVLLSMQGGTWRFTTLRPEGEP